MTRHCSAYNARPHTALETYKQLEDLFWTAMEYLPYDPDLSPYEELERHKFELKMRPPSFFDIGMKKSVNLLVITCYEFRRLCINSL